MTYENIFSSLTFDAMHSEQIEFAVVTRTRREVNGDKNNESRPHLFWVLHHCVQFHQFLSLSHISWHTNAQSLHL